MREVAGHRCSVLHPPTPAPGFPPIRTRLGLFPVPLYAAQPPDGASAHVCAYVCVCICTRSCVRASLGAIFFPSEVARVAAVAQPPRRNGPGTHNGGLRNAERREHAGFSAFSPRSFVRSRPKGGENRIRVILRVRVYVCIC